MFGDNFNINNHQKKLIESFRKAHPDYALFSDAEILSIMNTSLNDIKINEEEQISAFWNNNNEILPFKFEKKSSGKPAETHKGLNETIKKRLNSVAQNLQNEEKKNGFIGRTWNSFKNFTGIGDSSDKVRELQEKENELLTQLDSKPEKCAELFRELTGQDYTEENITKFINGEVKLKSELALDGYKEGQDMACDITGDIISGVTAVGLYSFVVATVPVTGGLSVAYAGLIGASVATMSGGLTKGLVKLADAKSGGREYDSKKRDFATGAFSGLLAPITAGLGGAIGKTVATKLGIEVFKQGAKGANIGLRPLTSVSPIFNNGAKESLKSAILNPTGYNYGGTIGKQALAYGAEMASDGAIGGAIDTGFRAGYDGGDADDILIAGIEGGIGGLFLAPVIGGGMKSAGKAGHFVGNKIKPLPEVKELDKFKEVELSKKFKKLKLSNASLQKINNILNNNKTTLNKQRLFKKIHSATQKHPVKKGEPRFNPKELKKITEQIESPYLKENKELMTELINCLAEKNEQSAFTNTKFYKFEENDIVELLNLVTDKNQLILKEMLKANEGKGLCMHTSFYTILLKRFSESDEKLVLKMINMVDGNHYVADNSTAIERLLDLAESYPENFVRLSDNFNPKMSYKMANLYSNDLENLLKRMEKCTPQEKELIDILFSPKETCGNINPEIIIKLLDADLGLNTKQIITLCRQCNLGSVADSDIEKIIDKIAKVKDKKFSFSKESIYKKDSPMTEQDIIRYLLATGVPKDVSKTFSKQEIAEPVVRLLMLDDACENMIFGGIPKIQMIKQILKILESGAKDEDLEQLAMLKSISRYLNKENFELYKTNNKEFKLELFVQDLNDNITSVECYDFCSVIQKINNKPIYDKDLFVVGKDMLKLTELKEEEILSAVSRLKELNLFNDDTNLITMLTRTKELLELKITPEIKEFAKYLSGNKYVEEASIVDFLKAVRSDSEQIVNVKINYAKELIENINHAQESIIFILNNLSSKNIDVLNKQINVLKKLNKTETEFISSYSKFIKTDDIEDFNLLNSVMDALKKEYDDFYAFETVQRAIRHNNGVQRDAADFVITLLNKKTEMSDFISVLELMQKHFKNNKKEFISLYLKGLETDLSALNKCKLEDLILTEMTDIKKLNLKQKITLYEKFSAMNNKGKAVVKELGLNYDNLLDKIINSIGTKRTIISTPAEQTQLFIKHIIANNNKKAEKILCEYNFEQFGKEGLPLRYPRDKFNSNVEELLKNLTEEEKEIILKHFGLETGAAGFDGMPNNKVFNDKRVSKKALENAAKIQKEIENFTLNNEVLISDKEAKEVLDGLIKGFPEFTSIVGKKQHGRHDYSVDIHTLKVLQSAINDPLYKTLSNQDKTILKYAVLLHDFGKKGGVVDTGHAGLSADYAWAILDRYPLPAGIKDRIIDIVDNHHWFEAFNTDAATAENIAVRCRRPEDLKIYEIFSKADFENVNPTFHLGEKTGGAANKTEFDAYMSNKFKAIEEAVNKIYQKANIIFDTQFMHNGKLFPEIEVQINGKKERLNVLDFNKLLEGEDLEKFGFAPGVTRDNARFVVHMTEPKLSNLETVFRLTESPIFQSTWSSSLIQFSNNKTYWGKDFGVIFDVPLANYSEAFWGNTHSGGEKTLDAFRHYLFGSRKIKKEDIDGKIKTFDVRHYVKNSFIQELEQKGYNLTETEYASLSQYLFNKKYISQIRKDIQIGDKIIKAGDLTEALEKSRDALFYGNEHSELIPINPKVKGLIAKVEKIEDCPKGFLKFAKEHDLPIILMKPSKDNTIPDKFSKKLGNTTTVRNKP